MKPLILTALALLTSSLGCSTAPDPPTTTGDTGTTDTGATPTDSGAADSSIADGGPKDSGSTKETGADTEPADVPYVPSVGAKYFCDGFKTKCVFGSKPDYYADYDTCTRTYDIYSTSQQICCANELAKGNCEGASGLPPCDK